MQGPGLRAAVRTALVQDPVAEGKDLARITVVPRLQVVADAVNDAVVYPRLPGQDMHSSAELRRTVLLCDGHKRPEDVHAAERELLQGHATEDRLAGEEGLAVDV